ncbi:hypothetical protein WICPIJ_002183 [Wickerhamomyces pijperi]|uniref:Peptidase M20 dimerisation domain-containing protein n=1 Tax=Wickerhamomyces pijperi TaxID=599730 RepID=A0A9P8TQF9_WICPI|nr:hypothetical protein WICPIJ_002183 [Wickerhamomyces pijperi]
MPHHHNCLDDNPITETSRRLPLRERIPTMRSSRYSPSPNRGSSNHQEHNSSNNIDSVVSQDEQSPDMVNALPLIHKWHHEFSILCTVAFPSRGLLFCGTQDHLILVYDMTTFQRKQILRGHTGSILCLTKSQDETLLFSGGSDSLVKVWDVSKMQESHTIYSLVDIGDIFSLTWSDKLNTLYFGCQNAAILFVHLLDAVPKSDASGLPVNRWDKFFDSKGPTGDKATVPSYHHQKVPQVQSRIIEIPSSNIIPYAHNGFIYSMKLFDDRGVLITGAGDGVAKIWKFNSTGLRLVKELDNDECGILSLTVHDQYLYCGLNDGSIKVWDLSTNQQLLSFYSRGGGSEDEDTISEPELQDEVLSLASSKNGFIFNGSIGGVTKWKFGTDIKQFWKAHDELILSLEIFERHGKSYLVTGGNDSSVAIWNINCGETSATATATATATAIATRHNSSSNLVTSTDNESLLSTLSHLCSFKTVSKKPELYIDDSRRCANFLRDLFKLFGAAESELIPVENGNPIVYSCFKANNNPNSEQSQHKPRILWYGHYDVIEAEEDSSSVSSGGWDSDPFKMTANDGYLLGRGVSDNKGPVLAAIYSIAELFQNGELTSDVVFLIEGEEECGSFGFQRAINDNLSLIGEIDWVLLSNSYWLDELTPCLNYGLRGVMSASIEICSDGPDRHSGVDGGVSREPTVDLIKLLGKLIDDDGKVLIPGFYNPISEKLTAKEEQLYDDIISSVANTNKDTLLAKWKYPSLTVHKIDVSGPRNNTVIPKTCKGSLSIRIVPEQNLEQVKQQFQSHVMASFKSLNSDNHVTIKLIHEAEPWLGDPSNEAFQILKEEVTKEWHKEPLFIREGGSIPSVRFLEKVLNAPAAQIPCGQSTDNAHLDNEKLRVTNLYALRRILHNTFVKLPKRNS